MPSEPQILQHLGRLSQQAREGRGPFASYSSGQEPLRVARRDARTRAWEPLTRTGTAQSLDGAELWQARMRDLQINNAQVRRACQILADLVVGPGIASFSDPFAEIGLEELMDAPRSQVLRWLDLGIRSDRRFLDWATSEDASADGKKDWFQMQYLALTECANQGDAFLMRCTHQRKTESGLTRCWQMIEREQLDTTMDRPRHVGKGETANEIVGGIEIDGNGRPVAYHVLQAHPGDHQAGTLWESQRVPADRMIHLYAFHRPSQHLGVTWWSAMAQPSLDKEKFIGSELATAIKVSLLAVVAKLDEETGEQGLGAGIDESLEQRANEMSLGVSPLAAVLRAKTADGGGEEDLKVVESNRPTPNAENFMRVVDHQLANGAGLSYFRTSGRYGDTNYSGIQAANRDDESRLNTVSAWLADRLCKPVRLDWQRQAGAMGLLGVSSREYSQFADRFEAFDFVGPGRELLDPQKEQEAISARLRGGLTTLKRECARQQLHWLHVLRQIFLENTVAEWLGIALDHSKGQGGQATGNTRSAQQQEAN